MISIVIFAAGRGSRLGASVPKFLVEVDSRPIFMHQLDALREIPGEIHIVCGYRASLLVQLMLDDIAPDHPCRKRLTFIHNDDFRGPQSGSIARALAVIPKDRPALFIDGDMLFKPDAAERLALAERTTALVRSEATADGVMATLDSSGNLVLFERRGSGTLEWGNLIRYSPEDLVCLEQLSSAREALHHFELINKLASSGTVVKLAVSRLAEVDDASDLAAASRFVRRTGDV